MVKSKEMIELAGIADLLQGTAGPMDMRSLAGQMGMAAQNQTVGGPVQMQAGMPQPGGMDMLSQAGGMPGPMGGPGMQNPMMQEMTGPPPEMAPESGVGYDTLLEFANMSDEDIIQLVLTTKAPEEAGDILTQLGQILGRPALMEAGMAAAGGMEAEMAGSPMTEGMV